MSKIIVSFIGSMLLAAVAPQQLVAEELRDPTRPLGYASAAAPAGQQLKLNSILISSERKLAIINGQTLRENDVIVGSGGVRVKRINANDVLLQQGTRDWKLSLNTASVRQ